MMSDNKDEVAAVKGRERKLLACFFKTIDTHLALLHYITSKKMKEKKEMGKGNLLGEMLTLSVRLVPSEVHPPISSTPQHSSGCLHSPDQKNKKN